MANSNKNSSKASRNKNSPTNMNEIDINLLMSNPKHVHKMASGDDSRENNIAEPKKRRPQRNSIIERAADPMVKKLEEIIGSHYNFFEDRITNPRPPELWTKIKDSWKNHVLKRESNAKDKKETRVFEKRRKAIKGGLLNRQPAVESLSYKIDDKLAETEKGFGPAYQSMRKSLDKLMYNPLETKEGREERRNSTEPNASEKLGKRVTEFFNQ